MNESDFRKLKDWSFIFDELCLFWRKTNDCETWEKWFVIETILVYTHWTQIILKSAQTRQRDIQPERRWTSDLQAYDHHSLKNTRILSSLFGEMKSVYICIITPGYFWVKYFSHSRLKILINTRLNFLYQPWSLFSWECCVRSPVFSISSVISAAQVRRTAPTDPNTYMRAKRWKPVMQVYIFNMKIKQMQIIISLLSGT